MKIKGRVKIPQITPKIQSLMTKKINVMQKKKQCRDETAQKDLDLALEEIEEEIDRATHENNKETVEKSIRESSTKEGDFSQLRFWKLKKKLYPDEKDSPTAKLDEQGNLITTTESLKNLYLKTYKSRLKKEIRHPQYQELFHMKEELWNLRYEKLKTVKTKDWDAKEIKRAIIRLKTTKLETPME